MDRSVVRAAEHFERAIEADPRFALALFVSSTEDGDPSKQRWIEAP
jgi:hypothetical protein